MIVVPGTYEFETFHYQLLLLYSKIRVFIENCEKVYCKTFIFRLLNEQLDETKMKMLEATNNCIKLSDQLDFAKERQEMLQKNDEHLKRVIDDFLYDGTRITP